MQLAIDTSTAKASIAIIHDNEVIAELTWHCGQSHTTELLPRLSHLLTQSSLSLESTTGIIVAKGPGSFNGLRVGISAAKGLALSIGIPIIGISTLEAAAYPHAVTNLPICPIFDARRGEISTAIYQQEHQQWRQLIAEHITTTVTLCSQISSKTIFCGEYAPIIAEELTKRLGQKAVVISPIAGLRRAGFLAELGIKRLEAGDHDDLASLQPLYLRRPPITKPKPGKR